MRSMVRADTPTDQGALPASRLSRDLSPHRLTPPPKLRKLECPGSAQKSHSPFIHNAAPKWEFAFFDLDDCLYKNDWATEKKITERIDTYLVSVLKLEPGSSNRLYRQYGTTIAGLIAEKHITGEQVQG